MTTANECGIEWSECFSIIIGAIEDIVISSEFQRLQNGFFEKNCVHFTHDEENKIFYMDIFNEYTSTIEHFIISNLIKIEPKFNLEMFMKELKLTNRTFDGEIFELLHSLTDFQTFKSLILDYKDCKMDANRSAALQNCLIVTKLND